MAVNTAFLALSMTGALVVFLVLYLIATARPWHYPVRETDFDFGVRERTTELLSRGASGESGGADETEEAEEPESFWERVKMGLYTYDKRPSKVQ